MTRILSIAVNESLSVAAANDLEGVRFLIAEPRVYVMSYQAIEGGEDKDPGIALTVDLLRDEIQAFGTAGVQPAAIALRKIWYGAFQSAFENSMLEVPYMIGGEEANEAFSASASSNGRPLRFTSMNDSRLPKDTPVALLEQLDQGNVVVLSESSLRAGARTWWVVDPEGSARALLAPTLGGAGMHWWQSHSNWRPTPYAAKISRTNLHPGMSHSRLQQEYQRAVRDALRQAYQKGGGQAAAQKRTAKAGKLPRTGGRPGGTEYTVVLEASSLATMHGALYWGLVLVAFTTVILTVVYAFVGVYKAVKYSSLSRPRGMITIAAREI